jgi:hypothetical protein
MKRLVAVGEARVDPRKSFGVAWVASFLGVVVILALTVFAALALSQS